jgi:hypothetical protein
MCRELKRLGLKKKDATKQSSSDPVRVQKLRGEYWQKVKNIAPENLVFIDEMGVLLID